MTSIQVFSIIRSFANLNVTEEPLTLTSKLLFTSIHVRRFDTKMIEEKEKVTKLEDLLAAKAATKENENENTTEEAKLSKGKKKQTETAAKSKVVIPKGKPKSGRVWKEEKKRFSSIVKTKGTRLSLEKKQTLRQDLKRAKEMSRELKAQKEAEKLAKKERRKENLKRAEENRKKSEVVQVIKNSAKIKRMKKKQLKNIEKRDTVTT